MKNNDYNLFIFPYHHGTVERTFDRVTFHSAYYDTIYVRKNVV